jgi:sigma-E factor negative regulatory protein RseC
MIEQSAMVVAVESGAAWVETKSQTSCGACAMNKGCGAGMFAKAFGFRSPRLRVLDMQGVEVGDQVVIGIDERALVHGSLAAYMTPILSMLVFAMVGENVAANWLAVKSDILTLCFGITGLAVGLLWVRRYNRRIGHDGRFQPVILQRSDNTVSPGCVNAR